MVTLEEMHSIERKYGKITTSLAVAYLCDVGVKNLSEIDDEAELERLFEASKPKGQPSNAFLKRDFELALCKAAWELSRIANSAEIICWSQRREYFAIPEWEDVSDE